MKDSKTIITCTVNPDLDGFACVIAYIEYLQIKNNEASFRYGLFGRPSFEVEFVMKYFNFTYPGVDYDIKKNDQVILVDCSNESGIYNKISKDKVVEIIDHRKANDSSKFINAKIQIELVGSAATLIAEKFYTENITPSKRSATLLFGAIISNTLNFNASVATERDIAMADWLKQQIVIPDNFVQLMFKAKSDLSGERLYNIINDETGEFIIGNKKLGMSQIEIVSGENLVGSRIEEILFILDQLKQDNHFDYTLLSIIDLSEGYNIFVSNDRATQGLFGEVFNIKFLNNIAKTEKIYMRKEIIPILKEHPQK